MNLPNKVFVDTSFFIALLNNNDNDHLQAVALQNQLTTERVGKITSEYVLLELGDGLSRLHFRHLASRLIELVYRDESFEVVPSSSSLFTQALALFNQRPDKEWGLTDCTSFIVMQEREVTAALTADHHYQQAGFRAILLDAPNLTPL